MKSRINQVPENWGDLTEEERLDFIDSEIN